MRRPYETLDVQEYSGSEPFRLRPPKNLRGREREIFIDLVTSVDSRHFRRSDMQLLLRYVEACALCEQAAGELAATGVVVGGKVSPWFTIYAAACKSITALSLRLRLGPQARQERAHKTTPGPVSFYDEMSLDEEGSDDAEGGAEPKPS